MRLITLIFLFFAGLLSVIEQEGEGRIVSSGEQPVSFELQEGSFDYQDLFLPHISPVQGKVNSSQRWRECKDFNPAEIYFPILHQIGELAKIEYTQIYFLPHLLFRHTIEVNAP